MEDKYTHGEYESRDLNERSSRDDERGSRDDKTFWFSLLSAVAVLAIVGLFLYAAQLNNQNNQTPNGVQPGVGGGPGNLSTPSPTPFPSFTPDVTPIPSSTAPTFP
jgi:hypothetical protein